MGFEERIVVSEDEQFINKLGLGEYKSVLLDNQRRGNELYEELKASGPADTPQEIRDFNFMLYNVEKYVREAVAEVLDQDKITPDIKKKLLIEILREMIAIRCGDNSKLKATRESFKKALTNIRSNRVNAFDNTDLQNVSQMIQDALQSESVQALSKQILHDKSKYGEHTQVNLQGLCLGSSLRRFELVQKLVADSIIIHRDASHVDAFIQYLQSQGIQDRNLNEISDLAITFHIVKMRRENPGISDDEIFKIIYERYISQGFIYQGINSAFVESAKQKGVTTKFSGSGTRHMEKIDEIFRAHGVQNVLLSKLYEISVDAYYYVTDDFTISQHYTYHNPEYFSFLTSIGPYMNDDNTFDQTAFYRRDIPACFENMRRLCERYGISEADQREIENSLNYGFQSLYPEGDINKPNGIIMIPRAIARNSLGKTPKQIENGDLHETLSKVIGHNVRNNYACRIDIPPQAVSVIKTTPLQEYFRGSDVLNNREDIRKFIVLSNGDALYYDIYIKSADPSDLDCILVDENQRKAELVSYKAKERPLTVDAIRTNPNLGLHDILDSEAGDAQPSFQTLMMMIAVNGVANSPKGTELLARAREEFTPEKMAQYYFFLSKKFLEIAGDKSFVPGIRLTAAKRVVSDMLPKAIYMSKTNRYPTDINPSMLLMTQYNFGKGSMLRKKLDTAQIEEYKGRKFPELESLTQEVLQYTNPFIEFDEEYEVMCNEWYDKLGFHTELQKANKAMKTRRTHMD